MNMLLWVFNFSINFSFIFHKYILLYIFSSFAIDMGSKYASNFMLLNVGET